MRRASEYRAAFEHLDPDWTGQDLSWHWALDAELTETVKEIEKAQLRRIVIERIRTVKGRAALAFQAFAETLKQTAESALEFEQQIRRVLPPER